MVASRDISEHLDEDAAQWHAIMHSGAVDAKTMEAFEAWLHEDRAHKGAYREYEQLYRDLDLAVLEAGVDVDGYLGRKRTNLWASLKAALPRPAVWGSAMAMLALLVVTVLTVLQGQVPATAPGYSTARAEIREVTLADGTLVTLGASSQIAAHFTENARQVTLLAGAAFFEVAKEEDRPFFVAAEDTLVKVVGTKFDVKHGAGAVHVAVLEGVVEVMRPDEMPKVIDGAGLRHMAKQVLTAGDRMIAPLQDRQVQLERVESVLPGSWREGRLAYENASLAEMVADANRYYDRPIHIAVPEIGKLRATMAFRTNNIDEMLELIEAIHPVTVDREGGEIILRAAP